MTKKSKTILIATIVLAAGAAVAVPIAVSHYSKPNFAKMTPRQVLEYFDSNEFRDANEQTRREIRQQMGEAMQARMTAQVNGYFALPEGEQRTAYLDKIIDEMQARRAEFLARRDPNRPPDANGFGRFGPPDANGRPRLGQRSTNAGQRPRINPERMRERSERISADTRVKMMQFRRDLQKRMEQRGIQGPMMGRGGPGGPGGFGRGFGGGPGGPPD
jgi:hypothetical protein